MDKIVSFGIGCFHFGIKKTLPFHFSPSEYIEELREALQSVPNVNNITIERPYDVHGHAPQMITEEQATLDSGGDLFPQLLSLRITFDLYIPFRLQEKLAEKPQQLLGTYTERFRVLVRHGYYLPVAFIELIDPSEAGQPSDAVQVVREFLEQELNAAPSGTIRFECLGPSPFHADCYIQAKETDGEEADWDVDCEMHPQTGYDDIFFYFNPKTFTDVIAAKEYIFGRIDDEVSLFYHIRQREAKRISDWVKLQTSLQELLDFQSRKGLRRILHRPFFYSSKINESFIAIAEFEGEEVLASSQIPIGISAIYKGDELRCFKTYIDAAMVDRAQYPVSQTTRLLELFENRRVKGVEFLAYLVSGISGGAVGAILTYLLADLLTR